VPGLATDVVPAKFWGGGEGNFEGWMRWGWDGMGWDWDWDVMEIGLGLGAYYEMCLRSQRIMAGASDGALAAKYGDRRSGQMGKWANAQVGTGHDMI
jgi:hypothetical protein